MQNTKFMLSFIGVSAVILLFLIAAASGILAVIFDWVF